jgi:cell division GTPase FtsZ
VGLVGVVGTGVFLLDRVAQKLDYPCKTIAIETNLERLRWCHPDRAVFIGDNDSNSRTINDARQMACNRKSEISQQVSSLNVAFLLTGLNGIRGRGVASVVADALRESGVFTIAITPGRRDAEPVRRLRRQVDALFEVPYDALMNRADSIRGRNSFDHFYRELLPEEIAQVCRSVTVSLAKVGAVGMDVPDLRSVHRGKSLQA